jgi:hypothetical protein
VQVEFHFTCHAAHQGGAGGITDQANPKKHHMPRLELASQSLAPHSDGVKDQGGNDRNDRKNQ